MEFDNTTILYIILGLIYFAFRSFVKKNKQAQNQPPRSDRPEDASETLGPPPGGRKSTFEELMEEFTTGRPAQRDEHVERIPMEQEVPVVQPSADFLDIEPVKALAKSHSMLKSTYERFEEFDDEVEGTSIYIDLIREPEGPKKAFVFSEIFKKKY